MKKQVLMLCGSMKPAPGREEKSASREVLKIVQQSFHDREFHDYDYLDLRELSLPIYDGRGPQDYGHEGVNRLLEAVNRSSHLIVSSPAYWRSAVGALINALNVLAGPLYDFPEKEHFLVGKKIYLIVVGADYVDAVHAASQLRNCFSSMGATVYPKEVLIGNVRKLGAAEQKRVVNDLYQLGTVVMNELHLNAEEMLL